MILCCLSCGVGRRRGGSDPALLCVCATAPIQPLAWEHPYVTGAAQEMAKKTKKKKKKNYIFSQFSRYCIFAQSGDITWKDFILQYIGQKSGQCQHLLTYVRQPITYILRQAAFLSRGRTATYI